MKAKEKDEKATTQVAPLTTPEALKQKMIDAIRVNNTAMSKAFKAGIRKGERDGES